MPRAGSESATRMRRAPSQARPSTLGAWFPERQAGRSAFRRESRIGLGARAAHGRSDEKRKHPPQIWRASTRPRDSLSEPGGSSDGAQKEATYEARVSRWRDLSHARYTPEHPAVAMNRRVGERCASRETLPSVFIRPSYFSPSFASYPLPIADPAAQCILVEISSRFRLHECLKQVFQDRHEGARLDVQHLPPREASHN